MILVLPCTEAAAILTPPRTETAADRGLDHPDPRLLHAQCALQHQMHVVRHLGRGADRELVALGIVIDVSRVRLRLGLTDLGQLKGSLANQIGLFEPGVDVADLEFGRALGIAGPLFMEIDRALGEDSSDAAARLRQRAWRIRILGALGRYDEAVLLGESCKALVAAPDWWMFPGQPPRPEAWASVLALKTPDRARRLADAASRECGRAKVCTNVVGIS